VAVTAAVLSSAAAPKKRPVNPDQLMESIGAPMQQHSDAAQQLLQSIPEAVKELARDPYSSRMLIYALLLDTDDAVRSRQIDLIKTRAESKVAQTLETVLNEASAIQPEQRLPLVDLSIPALRFLSDEQYASFRKSVEQLIRADEQVDLFEYALQRVLTHHLDPVFNGKPKPPVTNYYAIRGLAAEVATVLSVIARKPSCSAPWPTRSDAPCRRGLRRYRLKKLRPPLSAGYIPARSQGTDRQGGPRLQYRPCAPASENRGGQSPS
jgi:hypothetical protein